MFEYSYDQEPRGLHEILQAEHVLFLPSLAQPAHESAVERKSRGFHIYKSRHK
jgi:hypothetical protein